MENKEDNIVVNISKKDKLYFSIIAVLILVIVALAIVLPRPYKVVEIEKPVYQTVYKHVYDTQQIYIINQTSPLYKEGIDYIDAEGNEYKLSYSNSYIDTGAIQKVYVTFEMIENFSISKKTLELKSDTINLLVENSGEGIFGIKINFNSVLLDLIEQEINNCVQNVENI